MIAVATSAALPHLREMAEHDLGEYVAEAAPDSRSGWGFGSKFFVFLLVLLLLALALLYWQRLYFADYIVRDQLNKYGVRATYTLEKIGTRRQRLSNITVGDPANPDLTAGRVELETRLTWTGPVINSIRAKDVFLRGRYENGQFRFGDLDKFRDLNSKEPIEIPDYLVDLTNGRIALTTPWGFAGFGVNGKGALRNNFRGNIAMRSPELQNQDCKAAGIGFQGAFDFVYREPSFVGPAFATRLDCKSRNIAVVSPALDLNLKTTVDFLKWDGEIGFAASNGRMTSHNFERPKGKSKFAGTLNGDASKWSTQTRFALGTYRSGQAQLRDNKGMLNLDLSIAPNDNRWLGDIDFTSGSFASSQFALNKANGKIEFDGRAARTNFDAELNGKSANALTLTSGPISLSGKGHIDQRRNAIAIISQGQLALSRGILPSNTLPAMDDLIAGTRGTPVGPLIAKLIPELRRTLAGFDGRLRYDMSLSDQGAGKLRIDGADFAAANGGRLKQTGALAAISAGGNNWRLQGPLQFAISGGQLPTASLQLTPGAGGNWSGTVAMSNYTAPGASLSLSNLAFSGRPNAAWNVSGNALISGPLPGGRIDGLSLPINGNWGGNGGSLYRDCTTLAFKRLQYSNFVLPADSFRICPDAGRAVVDTSSGKVKLAGNIRNFDIVGKLGSSRLAVNSAAVRFDINSGFSAKNIDVSLGNTGSAQSKFSMATIDGRLLPNGIAGKLSGGGGRIGSVPLILSDTMANWSYKKGILALEGAMRVADAEQISRFKPVVVPDFMLEMQRNVITAIGAIHEPKTNRAIADVDLRHDLGSAKGRALFSVDNLNFDPNFQPELLTKLVLGVAANFNGRVDGDGLIEWSGANVKSNGRFDVQNMKLAAAFGPVEGLNTQIVFTDLLGLETGASQVVDLGSVNPGIPAFNGKLKYQLLPGRQVGIEGGTWPFAGGELVLEPTVLDFDILKPRRLTFRVVGVDAEKFFANYNFENLRVSGVFDGTLPMVFDSEGGRIIDGTMVSRAGGGEISYLGELTYADKGMFANYAFEALKSMKYQQLVISIAGKVDGEIITKVSFSGVQQGSLAKRNFITKQLSKIPLEFNVSISGQFMSLIGNLRGLYDPNYIPPSIVEGLIAIAKREAEEAKKAAEKKPEEIPQKTNPTGE
jgi:translocation and assembly module TamB